ncbi:hypothetical protein [Bradyrhizobium sp. Tv2a-2]|uniref:hypothetical protein n=1 Tax=Bradyrhizobium sp. Tv2a-2 TaxID=113395 RepID=UPI0003FE095F|nr:hypothetical protein [Bradyrhizobium sp. Tv2a-2]
MRNSRHLYTDLNNNIDPAVLAEGESCFVLTNLARVAAIKLLGSHSRDAYAKLGLSEKEVDALNGLYHTLQC